MLTFRQGVPGGVAQAAAYTAHLMERTLPEEQQKQADYYARLSPADAALAEEMGSTPRPQADMAPAVADALGVDTSRPLTREELGNILGGLRADGGELPGEQRGVREYAAGGEDGGPARQRTAWMDLTFSAPKSVSMAWFAAGTEAERQAIWQAHRDAAREAFAHVAEEIGWAGFGHGRKGGGVERGAIGCIEIDHFTARPTAEVTRPDPQTGVVATELYTVLAAGDPQLHTHRVVPNVMVTESGRVLSIDTARIAGRVHEFGAVYSAVLGRELRRIGVEVELDARTNMVRVSAVPEHVCQEFSKRTERGGAAAADYAARQGLDWSAMGPDQRAAVLKAAIKEGRRGKGDDFANLAEWRRTAERIGFELGGTVVSRDPPAPARPEKERIAAAREAALPHLEEMLRNSAEVTGSQVRLAAARGLIAAGLEDVRDVDRVTEAFAKGGVRQDGRMTRLLAFGHRLRPERARATTALHRDEERALIAAARAAARMESGGLSRAALDGARERLAPSMTEEQRAAYERLGGAGRFAAVVGGAGTGKTTALAPLVDAWTRDGREVWGTASAWRQANALREAGVQHTRTWALDPLLAKMAKAPEAFGRNSVVVLDELGQIGTRQMLHLLRERARLGFKLVAVGDDRQCQSVEAGPVIDLLRQALGKEAVPEILTTVRQHSERERELVGMFRDGRIKEALDAKRADGSAELAPGGFEEAVARTAALWAERTRANAADPRYTVTVSAPTNREALEIGRAIRRLRAMAGEVDATGRRAALEATDRAGNAYTLEVARGDRVRLFQRTRGVFAGKAGRAISAAIGDNGSVLTVAEVRPDPAAGGLVLRTREGKEGFVGWDALRDRATGRFVLSYGDCLTTHTAQGITSDEHIKAMPSGSAGVTLFAAHVGGSRHRVRSWIVGSMGAEMREAMAKRPVGTPAPEGAAASEAAWANVERNLKRQPAKASALRMLRETAELAKRARQGFVEASRRRQEREGRGRAPARGRAATREARAARTLAPVVEALAHTVEAQGSLLERAARTPGAPDQAEILTRVLARRVSAGERGFSDAVDMLVANEERTAPRELNAVHRIETVRWRSEDPAAYWTDRLVERIDAYEAGGAAALWPERHTGKADVSPGQSPAPKPEQSPDKSLFPSPALSLAVSKADVGRDAQRRQSRGIER